MNNVFKGINVGPVSTKNKIRNFMEKLEINATAITVQNETKKHFITGSTLFVESLLIIFFFLG